MRDSLVKVWVYSESGVENTTDENRKLTLVSADKGAQDGLAPAHMWAAMSHEIRTPLTGILGMLEILSSTSLTDEQRRMIATAEKSSDALMRIVNDVLDLARLEATSVHLKLKRSNISDLLEDCAEFLANQADAKGLILSCETDQQIPEVNCDPVRLRQVLTNLTTNAIKFTDTGGVRLLVSLVERVGSRAHVRFVVDDSGIGIPEELQTFLFQPFSQIIDTGERGMGGVGLGLAICRLLVEAMDGVVKIERKEEKGTRFVVELPFEISPALSKNNPVNSLGEQGLRVVAVESTEPAIQIATKYLRDAGADVILVDGLSALNAPQYIKFSDHPPVIVVGPDAEQLDVEAVSTALQKMQSVARSTIVWLHPRAVGGALSLGRLGIRTLRAYPLRREALLNAVSEIHLASSEGVQDFRFKRRFNTAQQDSNFADAARAAGKIVLVAEDNPINQQVLSQQLAILGIDCDIAGNGNAALQLMEEQTYALLLCDCHMPGMDGLELTRIVREREKSTGQHLPIIAVTANALPGEAERCKAAGMDDYLAKPLEIKNLQLAIERWMVVPKTAVTLESNEQQDDADGLLDLSSLRVLYGGDQSRVNEVMDQWIQVISEATEDLRSALHGNQGEQALEAVHRLKGSAGIAGARTLSAVADDLERALKSNDEQDIAMIGPRVISIAKKSVSDVTVQRSEIVTPGGG